MRKEFNRVSPEEQIALENEQEKQSIDYENMSVKEQADHLASLQELASLYHGEPMSEKIEKTEDANWKEKLVLAKDISSSVHALGGQAMIVGGFARDEVLERLGHKDIKSKDVDLEIYGIEFNDLRQLLDKFGKVEIVGESFGVLKINDLDISIPRKDSKTGRSHKDFEVACDPNMSVKEAARRRDFTFNALAMDPQTGEIIDNYGGVEDLKNGLIRATDEELFGDDPLRVLRAAQFSGRFNLEVEPQTKKICQNMDLSNLSAERVGEEWKKLLLKSEVPSRGLNTAKELGIVEKLHPELNAIVDTMQDKEWHPEGNVWNHSTMVVDAAKKLCKEDNLDSDQEYTMLLAALTHDLGKATTTETRADGHIISHGHEEASVEPAKKFMKSLKVPGETIKKVLPLVKEHLYPTLNKDANESAVRRLSTRLSPATIAELVLLAKSDHMGRDLEFDGFPQGSDLLDKAEKLNVKESKPAPYLRGHGKALIKEGMTPGPLFGHIMNSVYEMQLDGGIKDLSDAKAEALKLWQKTGQFKSGVRF
jgi:tRNA nucleotidyltransferase (CCA-adding enzyme)